MKKRTQLRIVHFASCTGQWGDATAMLRWASGQKALGHDARILLSHTQYSGVFAEKCRAAGVPVRELADVPLQDPAPAVLHTLRLWKHFLRERADVVHLHGGEATLREADIRAAQLLGKRVIKVATPHGRNWGGEGQAERWRSTLTYIHGLISPSYYARQFQIDAGMPKTCISVVHNAIEPENIDLGQRDTVRQEFELRSDQLLILFLARLDHVKRPLDAIESFSQVSDAFPQAILAIVGSGDLTQECQDLVTRKGLQDRVILAGYRTDVANWLHASDIYILPTEWELFTVSLLEAMAASLPIITTPVGGNLEAVTHGDTARIVEVGDLAGYSEALRFFLADSDLRIAYGQRARARVLKEFTTLAAAKKLVKAYEERSS